MKSRLHGRNGGDFHFMRPTKLPVKQYLPNLPSWEETLEEFLVVKKSEGRSQKTIQQYREFLGYFYRKYPKAWPDYHELKTALREYFAHLSDYAPATYNLNRAYLKAFCKWCVEEGYLLGNPMDGIPKRKDVGRRRDLDGEVVKKPLSLPNTSTYTGL